MQISCCVAASICVERISDEGIITVTTVHEEHGLIRKRVHEQRKPTAHGSVRE